jgi:hypothetical protein
MSGLLFQVTLADFALSFFLTVFRNLGPVLPATVFAATAIPLRAQ